MYGVFPWSRLTLSTISEDWRDANAGLHDRNIKYGSSGYSWAVEIYKLVLQFSATSILDYGCGKGSIYKALWRYVDVIHCYDPAVTKYCYGRVLSDIVVCTDVMEHVEPQFTTIVLADLKKLCGKVLFVNVSTGISDKAIDECRNAHANIQPASYWLSAFKKAGFRLANIHDEPKRDQVWFIGYP